MTITLWKPGRRLFSTAAVLMLVTAALHTVGNLVARPDNAEEKNLFDAMRQFHFPMGFGMSPSMQDIFSDLVFTMSITYTALGIVSLLVAASAEVSDGLLRRLTWANAVWMGASLVLNWVSRIPPPLICTGIIEAILILALLLPSTARQSPRQ